MEYAGDLGGLIEIVVIFGGLVTGFLIERKFMATLATATYQVQQYTKDKSTFTNAEKPPGNESVSSSSSSVISRTNTVMPGKSFKMDSDTPALQSSPFGKL